MRSSPAFRGRAKLGAALVGRLGIGSPALPEGRGDAVVLRDCPGDRAEREVVLGALAQGLPEVPAPELSRICRSVETALRLGEGVLRATAVAGVRASCRPAGLGLQMDPDYVPLVEGSDAV